MADKPETLKAPAKKDEVDPNLEQLNAESTKPQTATDATMQEGANLHVESLRSAATFGDNTSSRGDSNTPGLHGRDGGVMSAPEGGGPNNPVADDNVIDPSQDAPAAE